jgi:hypothetical protein
MPNLNNAVFMLPEEADDVLDHIKGEDGRVT